MRPQNVDRKTGGHASVVLWRAALMAAYTSLTLKTRRRDPPPRGRTLHAAVAAPHAPPRRLRVGAPGPADP